MGIATDRSADVLSLLSPTVVYAVPGEGPLSGVFRGRAEVSEHIGELFRITSGTFEVLKWVDWLVGLNHVAALQYAQAQGHGAIFRGHVVYVVETDQPAGIGPPTCRPSAIAGDGRPGRVNP